MPAKKRLRRSATDYVRYGEEAATLAQECDDAALRAAVCTFPAFGHVFVGDGREMLKWSGRVLDAVGTDIVLGRALLGWSPRVSMLVVRARAFACMGRLEEAWSQFRETTQVAEESRELEILGWLVLLSADLPRVCGGGASGLERARRSLDIAEESDNPSNRVAAYVALAEAHLAEGQPASARDAALEGIAIARDHGTVKQSIPWALVLQAEAARALGEPTEAIAAAREAIELARAGRLNYFEAQAQLALAEALLATGDALPRAEIESALARAEDLVEAIAARSLSPRILELRGRLAAALDRGAAADRLLRDALELYRTIGATGHAQRLAKEIGA